MSFQNFGYNSNIIHDYEFLWTIDNFSMSPDWMKGPSIPGFPGNLFMVLEYKKKREPETDSLVPSESQYNLTMLLKDWNEKDHNLTVSSRIWFCDDNDKYLKVNSTTITDFKGYMCLMDYTFSSFSNTSKSKGELSQCMKLLGDKLVVKGKLSFSGFGTATSVFSQVSENICEVSKDFQTMYECGTMSDVTFSVGEKTLRAHKSILASRSPVFAKMFGSDVLENIPSKIVIEDSHFNVFNCFLMFVYTGIMKDKKWDTVLALYSLAHKYEVKSLHEKCSKILGNSLTIDSVFSVLVLPHLDKELKAEAKDFIWRHIFQIARTTKWADLVYSNPDLVKEVLSLNKVLSKEQEEFQLYCLALSMG